MHLLGGLGRPLRLCKAGTCSPCAVNSSHPGYPSHPHMYSSPANQTAPLLPFPAPLLLQQAVIVAAISFIVFVFVLHIFGKLRS